MFHAILPTNKQLFRNNRCSMDRCPLCQVEAETQNHLIKCKSTMAMQWRKEILQELPKLLLRLHTKPVATRSLLICVQKALGMLKHNEKGDNKILQGQSKLSMEAFFDGLSHQEWTRRQDMHLLENSLWTPRSNGAQWTVQIIKLL
eukprot:3928766-Ditylum_brightwellii.AAC.1